MLDPVTNETVDVTETVVGMSENCAEEIRVTNALVFVACPAKGFMQVFRTDTLDNVGTFKLSTFTMEWDVISSPSGHHVYLILPMLDNSNVSRNYRLTIYEFIVDIANLGSRRGSIPIFS
jgi:hypothetical protein